MDDPGGVCYRYGVEHIHHQGDGLRRRQCTPLFEHLVQRTARHVLEHQEGLAVLDIGLVDRNNVGVTHPPDAARFLQPLRNGLVVRAVARAHHLDGDFALHARIESQPDGGLGALPQPFAQFETSHRGGRTTALESGTWIPDGIGKIGHRFCR